MNLIEKAAEALYPVRPKYAFNGKTISKDVNESRRRICIEDITHFLSYLSQQGDEEIIKALYVTHIANNDYRYYSEDITNAMMEALAIGRASNRWIPVTERLPEEKDAVEIDSIKSVEILWRAENYWLSTLAEWSKMKDIGYVSHWRTPSQYPEPPKSDI